MFVKFESIKNDDFVNLDHVVAVSYDAYTKTTLVSFDSGMQREYPGDQTDKIWEVMA